MKVLAVLPLMILFMSLNALLFMIGWNLSMPHLFHLPSVNPWQSLGLVFVTHTLLKGGVIKADFKG